MTPARIFQGGKEVGSLTEKNNMTILTDNGISLNVTSTPDGFKTSFRNKGTNGCTEQSFRQDENGSDYFATGPLLLRALSSIPILPSKPKKQNR